MNSHSSISIPPGRALLSLLLTLWPFLIPAAAAAQSGNHLLYNLCPNDAVNYTQGDSFAKNLTSVLDDLVLYAPQNYGFSNASSGQVYGLALCRGDVLLHSCGSCLHDARRKIQQNCNKRSAVVWYDYCLMKYSDYDFFGKIDTENEVLMWNLRNATDPKGFNETVRALLGSLSEKASQSSPMFANGESFESKENATIYGMAQCSRDLSTDDCKKCLSHAVNDLPSFTDTTSPVGGRTLTGSCIVRYETYVFLNDSSVKDEVVAEAVKRTT